MADRLSGDNNPQPTPEPSGKCQVRVVGDDGQPFGLMTRAEVLKLAESRGEVAIEICPDVSPPIYRLVNKMRWEELKRKSRNDRS